MPSNASPRRPKRASAVLADAKRKQNQDSSSEDDTHDIPKSLAPSRSKSSLSTGSGVAINRSNKRRRASSNASSSSLSSVSSIHDARPTPNKRFRKVAPPNNSSMPILKVQGPSDLQPSRLAPFISFSREFRRADSVRSTQSTSTVPDGTLASSQHSMSSIFPSLPDRNTSPEEWDPDNVVRPKALVFVKLTHCPPAPTSINDQGVVWWPVSVSKDGTDKVVLWNGTRHELLSMPSPTANNIVPAKDRFDNPNFNLSTYFVGSTTKPSGLDQLWTQTMRMTGVEDEDEDEDDRDGLQDSIYHVTANLSGTTSDVTEDNVTDQDDLEAEELQARLVDQRLTHIGKPVIVRLRNKDKYWWPARVIEIDISVSAKEIIYTVDVWEAARPKKVTRANLCFSTDPGFLTYSLGGREFTNSISSATEDEVRHWKMTEKVKREMTAIEAIIKDEYPPARKEVDYWYEHGVRHDKPSLGGEHQGELLHALLDVLLGETSANARFSSVEPTDGDDGLYEPVSDVPPSTVTGAAAGPLVTPARVLLFSSR
ncbi:hypothetical protein DL93DRAFT_695777 [Clavulina sp. PMI_390]|nr:hypothetical protein DL93DRAFT_695777 [Clavulina sp. PMI_390]